MSIDRIGALVRGLAWRGRSGRGYDLVAVPLESLSLADGGMVLLARGGLALWAGCADDVIADHHSRARFRLALAAADRAYRVARDGGDAVERMTLAWDLEGGEPQAGLSAA